MVTLEWLAAAVAAVRQPDADDDAAINRLRELLIACANGFAAERADVTSAAVRWPRRGLHPDEAAAFLRAVDTQHAIVDAAGYVTLPRVRPKTPPGRYALLSRSGDGVSINLEYLIQIGGVTEMLLDLGWPVEAIDFERGEYDALGLDPAGRVVLAMEAKARVDGPDSLTTLLREWIELTDAAPPATNAGRKYRELQRLCEAGPVTLWLVAAGARWSFTATLVEGRLELVPAGPPTYPAVPLTAPALRGAPPLS